ncbi:chemotaxis protein CheW [Geotalea sp. SG265]|uniref:chemotaxis protein CheW n=1 Tax=Geotalea sp. SG265 TaxID=2922867 RepID=UPI001FB03BD3|nr:chemotaxis protein CheW [Geotalea sp. SG265]
MSSRGGSMDLARFSQTFFEECSEHLADIERILLGLDVHRPDGEELNALFRSAHTIKGSAGIFGFDDMTVVTHLLESLLDRIRGGELLLSPAMIDLFLQAKDTIAMQLGWHRDGKPVNQQAVEEVCSSLQQLAEQDLSSSPALGASSDGENSAAGRAGIYEIDFVPDLDLFLRGARMDYLFDELAQLGTFTAQAEVAELPAIEEFDPEECHTRWRLQLLASCMEREIRDVFEFVADEGQLQVRKLDSTDGSKFTALPVVPPLQPAGEALPFGRRAYDRNEAAPGAFGRRGSETESSIRVGVAKVDQLINQVGELVITQAMLRQMGDALDPVHFENLHRGLQQLERNTRDLQQSVMSIRLVPISIVFNRFPRLVRELAAKLGKQVELKLVGETTELDKGLVEKIADPLTHLVRNALDHALEVPEIRTAAGKAPTGTVTLQASQAGGRVVIDVIDDGAGLNREKILLKAAERGIAAVDTMTDDEVWQLIFAPGFSTAEAVTDISGRGVGMDVVQKNVQSLGGRVAIKSERGRGTTVTISLPLTLAILDGLSVGVGEERLIVPINAIIESFQPTDDNLRTVNSREVVHVRGEYIPILHLHRIFNLNGAVTDPRKGILMVIEVEGEKGAILVDSLQDELQIVIKSMEDNYRKVEGTSGATILGDGRVALILDVGALMQQAKMGRVTTGVGPDRKEARVYAG